MSGGWSRKDRDPKGEICTAVKISGVDLQRICLTLKQKQKIKTNLVSSPCKQLRLKASSSA